MCSTFKRYSGVVVLVLSVCLILGALSVLTGCSKETEATALTEKEYKEQLEGSIKEYEEAYSAYSRRISEEMGAWDGEHTLSKEDITLIDEITSEFKDKANAAFDTMASLKAPAERKEMGEKVTTYAKAMKEVTVPALTDPLRAMREGETMANFSEADGGPSQQKAAMLTRANADFLKVLEELGIDIKK